MTGAGRDRQSACPKRQTAAALDPASVGIFAQIGAGVQELLQQIAVRAVDFDAVKPCCTGITHSRRIAFDQGRDLGGIQRTRRLERRASALMRYLGPILAARLRLIIVDEAHQVVPEANENTRVSFSEHSNVSSAPLRAKKRPPPKPVFVGPSPALTRFLLPCWWQKCRNSAG